jgi:phosphate uptake regulator
MKRTIIRQGIEGRSVNLPISWVREQGLEVGDEIDVAVAGEQLLISGKEQKKSKREIVLRIKNVRFISTRMIITNAYRAGFDVIHVKYDGHIDDIKKICQTYLIGFEATKTKEGFVLESISEPSYDNFEAIITRLFYMLEEILKDIKSKQVEQITSDIQRYDNFLKRCIAKGMYSPDTKLFVWQFLSNLAQIGRICVHFNADLQKKVIVLAKTELAYMTEVQQMFSTLKEAYLKKNIEIAQELHQYEERIVRREGKKLLGTKQGVAMYHIMNLVRMIYLSHSPLLGIIMKEYSVEQK